MVFTTFFHRAQFSLVPLQRQYVATRIPVRGRNRTRYIPRDPDLLRRKRIVKELYASGGIRPKLPSVAGRLKFTGDAYDPVRTGQKQRRVELRLQSRIDHPSPLSASTISDTLSSFIATADAHRAVVDEMSSLPSMDKHVSDQLSFLREKGWSWGQMASTQDNDGSLRLSKEVVLKSEQSTISFAKRLLRLAEIKADGSEYCIVIANKRHVTFITSTPAADGQQYMLRHRITRKDIHLALLVEQMIHRSAPLIAKACSSTHTSSIPPINEDGPRMPSPLASDEAVQAPQQPNATRLHIPTNEQSWDAKPLQGCMICGGDHWSIDCPKSTDSRSSKRHHNAHSRAQ